ncbi:MAG: topoisomerase C-terminal repeat-containing protein [Lachnospiraceae bacterium]|nr:topoisomerase C-terminal repeat-containing protein [Lachnospiraceae bacterium]
MGKALIITEKPSVAKEFARVLKVNGNKKGYIENDSYVISWCVGHLVGLIYPDAYDEKYKKWKKEDLPFLPVNYKYDVIADVKEQYAVVHSLLYREDIDVVYWAGDAGKEGQTIEENIRNFGGVREGMKELRVWIDSQTDEELLRGLKEARPMTDYKNLGLSGIMRTIEDYAMGINFTRIMSINYGDLLNKAANTKSYTPIAVGRVMTCVLGMVVIREREIRQFKETPFYKIIGIFADKRIKGEWKAVEGSKYLDSYLLYKENGFKEEKDAKALIDELTGKEALVSNIEKGTTKKKPPLLFNLAELQAECSKRFKITPDETLKIAQTLYERKLTTYPRTDARVLSTAVSKEIIKNLSGLKGYEPLAGFVNNVIDNKLYEGIAKTQYTDDSKITDHYAIIPTGQVNGINSLNQLERDVYELIARRFISIFYPPAVYENIKVTIKITDESFFASGKVLTNPGYLEVMGKVKTDEAENTEDGEENISSAFFELAKSLKAGDSIEVNELTIGEGKTSPPKRYTSGSMILAMENAGQLIEDEELRAQIKGSGIGTSATRAEIIEKLIRNAYIALNKKTQVLTPTVLGEMIFEVVDLNVPALLNPKMTASWEKGLDGITNGAVEFTLYRQKLEDYIRTEMEKMINSNYKDELVNRISEFVDLANGENKITRIKIGAKCPKCGGEFITTLFGYGCENYSKDGNGCNFAIGKIAGADLPVDEVRKLLTEGKTSVIRGLTGKSGKKFDAVLKLNREDANDPKVEFDFSDKEAYVLPDIKCPLCGAGIVRTGFGFACVNRDKETCKFSVGTILGKLVTEKQLKALLTNGKTDLIKGFKSKTGKKFDAILVLDNGSVKFEFPDSEEKESMLTCKRCGKRLIKRRFNYECECGFKVSHVVAKKELTEEQVGELLTTGVLKEKVTGFTSKKGTSFDAWLKYNENEGITFSFEEEGSKNDGKSEDK